MPSNTIPVKWLQDKNGNEFYPVTHKNAIRDDNGNPIAIPEVLDDLNDVAITSGVTNAQTYFENAVQDYDGNWYDAVIIGDQVWMAENLRTTHYANGTSVEAGGNNESTSIPYYYDPTIGGYYSLEKFGLWYNWAAVMNGASSSNTNPSGIQGIAPDGWHIPSKSEYEQLVNYLRSNSEYWADGATNTALAKSIASKEIWITDSTTNAVGNDLSKNNISLFNAMPAGSTALVQGRGWEGQTATQHYSSVNYKCRIEYNSATINTSADVNKADGSSVRCLYNGTVAQFREQMAAHSLQNQILKHDGNHWVNTEIDHDFTFDSEIVSTSSATVTFGASQRGTHFIAAEDDFSITFSVNNESDNYLWIRNTGNSAIQIYIQDVTHNGSRVQNIYMPEDDIIIQPGYAGEIGIVCNSAGAFITMRCDLKHMVNDGITT